MARTQQLSRSHGAGLGCSFLGRHFSVYNILAFLDSSSMNFLEAGIVVKLQASSLGSWSLAPICSVLQTRLQLFLLLRNLGGSVCPRD